MELNKGILAVSGMIVALSVGYYFVVFLPTSKNAEILSANQAKCNDLAAQALRDYNNEAITLGGKPSGFAAASSHYNTKLNQCIVQITDLSITATGRTTSYVFLQNATESRDLAACTSAGSLTEHDLSSSCYTVAINGNDNTVSQSQFDSLQKDYLTQ